MHSLRKLLPLLIAGIILSHVPHGLAYNTTGNNHPFPDGYCTAYAAKRFDDAMRPVPGVNWSGHAKSWIRNAKAQGWTPVSDPAQAIQGAAMVWDDGGLYGHVGTFERLETRYESGRSVRYVVLSEMNWGILSPSNRTDGVTLKFNIVTSASLRADSMNRGRFTFLGFINPRPNTRPTVPSGFSASSSFQGDVTVTFRVNDSNPADRIIQTDVWVEGTNGAFENGIRPARHPNGAKGTAAGPGQIHSVTLSANLLCSRLINGTYYRVVVRAYDSFGAASDISPSIAFRYNLPTVTATPEIAIRCNGTEIAHGSSQNNAANFGTVNVLSPDYRTYTIANAGNGTLTLGTLNLGNTTDFSIYSYPPSSLAPGQTTSFILKFYPRSAGAKTCDVSLVNNDSNENPYWFRIGGTAQATSGGGNATTSNAMDRFAATAASWLGTYTGQSQQDSYYTYRRYSSGQWLANRTGTNQVWHTWNGQWIYAGNW